MSIPKISIITVVYNAADALEDTINSVLAQTFDNWEFIIVDGASTDGTIDILKRFNSSKILWTSEVDNGIYDAMNKGITRASGEWVYFLGADDTFVGPEVLGKVFQNKTYEADFVYGKVYDQRLKRNSEGEFDKTRLLQKNICHQAIFFKRDLFKEIGYYQPRYRLFADWDFNLKCFSKAEVRKKYIDVVVANYSEGGASAENNDLLFFREVLFPERLNNLHKEGLKKLRNVRIYDEWWRLLRSMHLEKKENLSHFSGKENLPGIIRRMHSFQTVLPYRLLKNGFISKSYMFLSYGINLLTN